MADKSIYVMAVSVEDALRRGAASNLMSSCLAGCSWCKGKLCLSLNCVGVGALALILRATPKLVSAGNPIDMGLLVPELCPDPLLTQPIEPD